MFSLKSVAQNQKMYGLVTLSHISNGYTDGSTATSNYLMPSKNIGSDSFYSVQSTSVVLNAPGTYIIAACGACFVSYNYGSSLPLYANGTVTLNIGGVSYTNTVSVSEYDTSPRSLSRTFMRVLAPGDSLAISVSSQIMYGFYTPYEDRTLYYYVDIIWLGTSEVSS